MSSAVKEIYPIDDDTRFASEALVKMATQSASHIEIEVSEKIKDGIVAMLEKLANKESVAILSVTQEFSTNEAAEILRVSRPFLTKLLDKGAMPFRQVGSHRRIEARDLFFYKSAQDKEKEEAFSRMAKITQEIEND